MRNRAALQSFTARTRGVRARLAILVLLVTACSPEPPAETVDTPPAPDTAFHAIYSRELLFVGRYRDQPLVVPFSFLAVERGEEHERIARAWLAHAGVWDPFLDQRWTTPQAAGAWRVVPHGDLRVIADGVGELDALLFRRGDRTLRLTPGPTTSTFAVREELQHRLHRGRLEIGGQPVPGAVLEVFELRSGTGDELEFAGAQDWLFASDGDGVHLLLAEAMGAARDAERTFAWLVRPQGDRSWDRAEIRWLEMRPVEQARRDAPVRWSFTVPGGDLEGEVVSVGYEIELGPDRAGRRSLKLRHAVEGWIALGDERVTLVGMLRHSQE